MCVWGRKIIQNIPSEVTAEKVFAIFYGKADGRMPQFETVASLC